MKNPQDIALDGMRFKSKSQLVSKQLNPDNAGINVMSFIFLLSRDNKGSSARSDIPHLNILSRRVDYRTKATPQIHVVRVPYLPVILM